MKKEIKKLEAKLDALTQHLGLKVCCEEDDDGFFWCVVKRYKNKWKRFLR